MQIIDMLFDLVTACGNIVVEYLHLVIAYLSSFFF